MSRAPRRAAQHAVDRVVMDQRAAAAAPVLKPSASIATTAVEILARERAIRPGAAHQRVQLVLGPFAAATSATICCASTSSGARGSSSRSSSPRRTLSSSAAHSTSSSRVSGNSRPLGTAPIACPARPDALQERRDRARRAELAHQVDLADVDAQLERGGRHQRLQLAGLEPLLGVEPLLLGRLPWCAATCVLAQALGELCATARPGAAGVDEDQRGAMRLDQLGQPVVDLCPPRSASPPRAASAAARSRGRGRAPCGGRCR